jgi:hypothetical protein
MDGGAGGNNLLQEALSAPLSAGRPLTAHRRSPRFDSPLWKDATGFLEGTEVADMLK